MNQGMSRLDVLERGYVVVAEVGRGIDFFNAIGWQALLFSIHEFEHPSCREQAAK